jgi:nitrite reductase (NADH) small subunit
MDAVAHDAREGVFNLGPVSRIPPGEGRSFQVGGLAVAIFRLRDGKLFATQATCPHRKGPLADGLLGGGLVVCPLHGFRFDLATGRPIGNECAPLCTFPVEQSVGGDILLTLRVEIRS